MALSLPDPTFDDESTRRLYPTLPLFEGFPYLVTRVVPAMYHLILLPVTASELELVLLARTQWRANRLETCLVTGADRARFISADGRDALAQTPPRGGTLVTGCLKRARPFADTLELWARQHRLDAIVEACRRKDGYMFGDLTKGGRDATPDEVGRLAGTGPEGRPRGLECCQACEEWRGRCLDPSPVFPWKVMTVHCRCQNDNRCAACGGTLYERKFNANYFQPSDGHIWHVPGFCSFRHRCPTPIGARDDAPQGGTDEQAIWRDQGQDAVYGAVDGELIFIERARAHELVATQDALWSATTCGELKARMPAAEHAELFIRSMAHDLPDFTQFYREERKEAGPASSRGHGGVPRPVARRAAARTRRPIRRAEYRRGVRWELPGMAGAGDAELGAEGHPGTLREAGVGRAVSQAPRQHGTPDHHLCRHEPPRWNRSAQHHRRRPGHSWGEEQGGAAGTRPRNVRRAGGPGLHADPRNSRKRGTCYARVTCSPPASVQSDSNDRQPGPLPSSDPP
jgi:hypothetical protein